MGGHCDSMKITSRDIWESYVGTPDTHRNIPNCSYAGYQCGERPIPSVGIVVNVTHFGARADGLTDDTAAIQCAIDEAGRLGGGAVHIPAGRYHLAGMLHIGINGVVLRGEGPDKTILAFSRPLRDIVSPWACSQPGSPCWGWSGGLIWISPESPIAFSKNARSDSNLPAVAPVVLNENWVAGRELGLVRASALRGDDTIALPAEALGAVQAGSRLLIEWANESGNTLAHHIAGHERMRNYPWHTMSGIQTLRWPWIVEVAEVRNGALRLRQPLRLDIRPEWNVRVYELGRHISGIGVEDVCLEMPTHERLRHCRDDGYNGIYFNRCVHGWARNILLKNIDNGVGVAASKNVTIRGLSAIGQSHHHFTATRVFSHDNLVEDFRLESQPLHGLNVEGLSSGNVWHCGHMAHGTFDSHRGMSFDCLYSDITLPNDGIPGGNIDAGPFLGARCVRWNIRIASPAGEYVQQAGLMPDGTVVDGKDSRRSGVWINQPDLISDGALVGIQGAELCAESAMVHWSVCRMAPGDKNCIIADHGQTPWPPNLYASQLALRLQKG